MLFPLSSNIKPSDSEFLNYSSALDKNLLIYSEILTHRMQFHEAFRFCFRTLNECFWILFIMPAYVRFIQIILRFLCAWNDSSRIIALCVKLSSGLSNSKVYFCDSRQLRHLKDSCNCCPLYRFLEKVFKVSVKSWSKSNAVIVE